MPRKRGIVKKRPKRKKPQKGKGVVSDARKYAGKHKAQMAVGAAALGLLLLGNPNNYRSQKKLAGVSGGYGKPLKFHHK